MVDALVVIMIVAAAAWYVFRRFAAARKGDGCGCGGSCGEGCCPSGNRTGTGCSGGGQEPQR